MRNYNPKNERIKHEYYLYLKHARRRADSTINGVRKAIDRYEDYTGKKDFSTFNKEKAMGFVRHLAAQKTAQGDKALGTPTRLSTLNNLKGFFLWLAMQEGYKREIKLTDIEYLNMSEKEERAAKAAKIKKCPSLEQIRQALFAMPYKTVIDRRNRALVALTILTGARVNALVTLRLKHVLLDQDHALIDQRPDEVATKFSKTIFSYLLPIGDDIQAVFRDWIRELRQDLGYSDNDPVFPQTRRGHDENMAFQAQGLEPICWSTTAPVREIFRQAFENAGLPYYHPHSFRHTLAQMMSQYCKTFEDMKAWSQNLGHEHINTTAVSYHKIDPERQGQILKGLSPVERGVVNQDLKKKLIELAEALN